MTHTFTDALAVVLNEEGGYSDNPSDNGGMTNLGVTAATWAAYTGQPATEAVMRALTPAQVTPLYKTSYWNAVAGDQLGAALALPVFDFAVNSGASHAAKTLQGIIGATTDGSIGPSTSRAVKAYIGAVGLQHLIEQYSDARATFYRSLPTFGVFGKGWLARVDRIEDIALSWIG